MVSNETTTKYIEKIIQINTGEYKEACLQFLTQNSPVSYSAEYINSLIEYSDYCIYLYNKTNNSIVAFTLFKLQSKRRGNLLNIVLVAAVPNRDNFAILLVHSLCNFAINHQYSFLYVSPKTPELRKAFIGYEFESIYGREGIDEVLEKEIEY